MTRPVFPENARMVFCIGAQKAGTTWLYDALRQSPNVHFSRNKELHYFDVISGKAKQVMDLRIGAVQTLANRLVSDLGPRNGHNLQLLHDLTALLKIYTGQPENHDAYLSYLLEQYSDESIVCDITPAYAVLDRKMFEQMARIGTAQFVFILRDPIDRMWSQIRMAVKTGNTSPSRFQGDCEARAWQLVDNGRLPKIERADYQRTIIELEAAVPADRIQYMFYETLFQTHTMAKLCGFLGIPPITTEPEKRSNPGTSAALPDTLRSAFHKAFSPQYAFIHRRFGPAVPDSWAQELSAPDTATQVG